jgi:predicted nucleic acid-binding protein
MTTVFVDSSAWIAVVHLRDSRHAQARAYYRTIMSGTKLMTSDHVLGESITFLTYRHQRQQAIELHSMVQAAIRTNVLTMEWITPAIHDQAWEIYQRFDHQIFSYCDCTSFALCVARGVDLVFTFDNDFEIAGLDRRPAT